MADDLGVRRVPDDEVDGLEGWDRLTDEPEIRGVEAIRLDDDEWPWIVVVWVAEFVREDPLEAELREAMLRELSRVRGVEAVAEEDREVWIVAGVPDGRELVKAAAAVVDGLYEKVATQYPTLVRRPDSG